MKCRIKPQSESWLSAAGAVLVGCLIVIFLIFFFFPAFDPIYGDLCSSCCRADNE